MWVILCLGIYAAGLLFRRNNHDFALVSFAAIAMLCIPSQLFTGGSLIVLFCAMALCYGAVSMGARCLTTALSSAAMAVYCLIFALDSWLNYDVETWIYNNHEIIVFLLHILIVVSTFRRIQERVYDAIDNFVFDSGVGSGSKKPVSRHTWRISKTESE